MSPTCQTGASYVNGEFSYQAGLGVANHNKFCPSCVHRAKLALTILKFITAEIAATEWKRIHEQSECITSIASYCELSELFVNGLRGENVDRREER